MQAGKTPNGSIIQYFGSAFPLFAASNLSQGLNMYHSRTYLSVCGLKDARLLRENSIVVCCHGVHLGKAGITRTIGACNSRLISITPLPHVLPENLYY